MGIKIGAENVGGLKIAGERVGGMKVGTEMIFRSARAVSVQLSGVPGTGYGGLGFHNNEWYVLSILSTNSWFVSRHDLKGNHLGTLVTSNQRVRGGGLAVDSRGVYTATVRVTQTDDTATIRRHNLTTGVADLTQQAGQSEQSGNLNGLALTDDELLVTPYISGSFLNISGIIRRNPSNLAVLSPNSLALGSAYSAVSGLAATSSHIYLLRSTRWVEPFSRTGNTLAHQSSGRFQFSERTGGGAPQGLTVAGNNLAAIYGDGYIEVRTPAGVLVS